MIKLYERLTKNCQSQNMLNKIHISLENKMTPQEFIELYNSLRTKQKPNKHTILWIKKLKKFFLKTKKTKPEPFIKKNLDRYTVYFSSKEQTIKKEDKTLLICFTGAAKRMMMPLPIFLQYLDSKNVDVILFKYPNERGIGYKKGMPQYDNSFEDMLNRLGSLPFNEYKNISAMGTSGGALTALIVSLKYEFNSVLSVGADTPNDSRWSKPPITMIEYFQKNAIKSPSIYLAYGSGSERDVNAAYELKTILPNANLIQIGNKIRPVGHAALLPLIKNGKFSNLLDNTIFDF